MSRIPRFFRFCFVGGIGTIVNLAILYLLVHLAKLDTFVSAVIATEIAVLVNFTLNHLFTFKAHHHSKEPLRSLLYKVGKFNLSAVIGATIQLSIFAIFFKVVKIEYLLADLLSIFCSVWWNYFISTRYIWRMIDSPLREDVE